jgi:hypothetical protein
MLIGCNKNVDVLRTRRDRPILVSLYHLFVHALQLPLEKIMKNIGKELS